MEENVKQEQIFDLTGGLLCLDFANTLDNRTDVHPQELLNSYNDLVLWSQQADVSSATSCCDTGSDFSHLQAGSRRRIA